MTIEEPVVDVESLIQIEDGISLDQLKEVNDAFEVNFPDYLTLASQDSKFFWKLEYETTFFKVITS